MIDDEGITQLRLKLQRLKSVPLAANEELKVSAVEMRTLVKKMAPVDKANLEAAIKLRYEGTQGAGGRFVTGGGTYVVYVDNDMPVEDRNGKTVGDYAWEIHEHLTPAGEMKLGPLSVEKQDADPSITVGGWFMSRAAEEMRPKINENLAKVVVKYIEAMDI